MMTFVRSSQRGLHVAFEGTLFLLACFVAPVSGHHNGLVSIQRSELPVKPQATFEASKLYLLILLRFLNSSQADAAACMLATSASFGRGSRSKHALLAAGAQSSIGLHPAEDADEPEALLYP